MKDFSEFTLILYPERPWNVSQMVNITDGAQFEGTPLKLNPHFACEPLKNP